MLLGALVDVGAPVEWLHGLPARLGLEDVSVEIAPVVRCGVRSTKVTVRLAGAVEGPGDVADHAPNGREHAHEHHGHGGLEHHHTHDEHPHRQVGDLLKIIDRAPVSGWVRERATRAFRLLAEAEGRIHGVAPEAVALHEVGAFDALVDIVGAVEGFEQLDVTDVYTRPVALGNGWVRAAHGVLSVPTPATSLLIEGLPIAPDGPVVGEATTPTGAALLRALASTERPPAPWRPVATGWGAGGRDPERYPNALRIALGEAIPGGGDEMIVVATDLDDFSPEYLEPLREALSAAGAVDVQSWATAMKKGRIGFRVEAIAPHESVDAVITAFFSHSSTAGVRHWGVSRSTLSREQWTIRAPDGGSIRVKTIASPGGPRVKPEYDDVIAAARRTGQPAHELARRFQEEALRLVRARAAGDEGADHDTTKES